MGTTAIFERLASLARLWTSCFLALFVLFSTFEIGCDGERRVKRREARVERRETRRLSDERATSTKPSIVDGLTSSDLLQSAVDAYKNAKYYSDAGYVEMLCELEGSRTLRAYRVPCSLSFAKPNYARVEFGSASLRSDGQTIRAEIRESAYENQVLERPAPLLTTSIKEFYPDALFAEAASLGVPANIFWTSPQLILLLAEDPLKTLVPEGSKTRLLEPEFLRFEDEEPIVCDRALVEAEDGARVYWFERESKRLARCDLPVERQVAPESFARVASLRLEFPRQFLSDKASLELSSYRFAENDLASRRVVERFLPPEASILGRAFPVEALRPLANANEETSVLPRVGAGRKTALCLWDANDFADRRLDFFDAFENARRSDVVSGADYAVVLCDAQETSDETMRTELLDVGSTTLGARLDLAKASELAPEFGAIRAPSFLLLDEEGRALKYVDARDSTGDLTEELTRALTDSDSSEEKERFYKNARLFADFIDAASTNDLYRSAVVGSSRREIPPRRFPKNFILREQWSFSDLHAPVNPIAVSSRGDSLDKQGTTSDERSEDGVLPIASQERTSGDMLIVPCDGAALALLSSDGRLVRKTTSSVGADEPITFVRSIDVGANRRYYVASARLQSRMARRFDENFNDLGALDLGANSGRRVGDARFVDLDEDDEPELLLGLVDDASLSVGAASCVYAVEMASRKIRWKRDAFFEPYLFAVDSSRAFWTIERAQEEGDALVRVDLTSGERTVETRAREGETFLWLASSTNLPQDAPRVVAIVEREETKETFLVGYSSDGLETWRNPIDARDSETFLEPILSGDVDGDGYDEWLTASPNGVVRFFESDGTELGVFQYGKEISGVCVARWSGGSYLVVTDASRVVAWKIEALRQ